MSRLYTIQEIADLTGYSYHYIYYALRDRDVPFKLVKLPKIAKPKKFFTQEDLAKADILPFRKRHQSKNYMMLKSIRLD